MGIQSGLGLGCRKDSQLLLFYVSLFVHRDILCVHNFLEGMTSGHAMPRRMELRAKDHI